MLFMSLTSCTGLHCLSKSEVGSSKFKNRILPRSAQRLPLTETRLHKQFHLFSLATFIILSKLSILVSGQILKNGGFEADFANWNVTGSAAIAGSSGGNLTSDGSKALVFNLGQQPANGVV